MKRTLVLFTASLAICLSAAEWTPLFNGRNFDGLERFLAPPGGLNNDPQRVFSIANIDGAPAIHVSGERYGGISTTQEFGNVHIRLEYKWGEKKWPPRASAKYYRDAGLLYWCIGPHGAGSQSWMRSIECNIMEKGVGQWWSVADTFCDVRGRTVTLEREPSIPYRGESPGEKCVLWDPSAPTMTVQPSDGITAPFDFEKPHGQWNQVEVYAWGGVCLHLLNGQLMLVITNPRYRDGSRETRLARGKIQLQSEAAEIFYRGLEAREIDSLPRDLLSHVPMEPDTEAGFVPLLTGEQTNYWKQSGPGSFILERGIATGHLGMGLWWNTNRAYTNFVLRGEWRQAGEQSDSGVFFRFPNPGNDPWIAVRQGHEFEIGENSPKKAEEGTGSFYPFHGPARLLLKPYGEWNQYQLACIGPNYALWINGELVNTWTDNRGRPLSGYIGLQNYAYPEAVQHRRLRIKDLL